MHRDTVVFLGPSLPIDEARKILPAVYMEPARCGDVLRARCLAPRVIAIIDGVFAHAPSIWHKEILLALEDGISVFGASSMGALRAAELEPFGMVGIGRIFEAYRDGRYADDDEVALLHGPAESAYRELSEAMVNIRATLEKAVSCGVIQRRSAECVLRCAKQTFYQERSIASAIEAAWPVDPHAEERRRLEEFVAAGGYVNQKRLDALELLEHLASRRGAANAHECQVNRTAFIARLHFDVSCSAFPERRGDLPRDERVALEARSLGRLYPPLCRLARLMALAYAFSAGDGVHEARGNRLARLRGVMRAYQKRNASGPSSRAQRCHMLDMMRLDGSYAHRFTDGAEAAIYRRSAALWAVIHEHLQRLRFEPIEPLQTRSDEFRRRRGLESRSGTLVWRRAQDLDGRGYERIVALDSRLNAVTSASQAHVLGLLPATGPACWLIDAIRMSGLYVRLSKRVDRHAAVAADAKSVRCARIGRRTDKEGAAMAKSKRKPAKKSVKVKNLKSKKKTGEKGAMALGLRRVQ